MSVAPRVGVIVVAAGSGVRLGSNVPKAFVVIGVTSILNSALRGALALAEATHCVVVAPEGWLESARESLEVATQGTVHSGDVVTGGATRHASVEAGLAALPSSVDVVLVHDAARCLTPPDVFERVVAAVRTSGRGVVPGLAVTDTIKIVQSGHIVETVNREELLAVQTPQGFPRADLERAYSLAENDAHTDDASVFTHAGFAVDACEGSELSFKITTPADLARAAWLATGIDGNRLRVGTATDTHAFSTVRGLRLAGLDWPDEFALAGHSDGDAVAHAVVDALLAAAGLGDIGAMVGIDDPAYAKASGDVFVHEALRRLADAGFRPVNVTAQIVGNRPRLASRRSEAERVLSEWVGAPVSLSATTTDGLGFTGEGKGIAVVATALIARD